MIKQRTFGKDVEFGDEIGPMIRRADYKQAYAQAYANITLRGGGQNELRSRFLDADVAKALGLAGPILPGPLLQAFVGQLLTSWHGPQGWMRSLNINFRRAAYYNEDLRCLGLVTDTREEGDQTIVKLDVFMEDIRGERAVQGVAEVALPTGSV